MNRLPGATIVAVLMISVCLADDGSKAEVYIHAARAEFDTLLLQADETRRSYWREQTAADIERYGRKHGELQAVMAILKRMPDSEEHLGIFAFRYLNEVRELELDRTTRRVEELGWELYAKRKDEVLDPALATLSSRFESLKTKTEGSSLVDAYKQFLQVRRDISQWEKEIPVKHEYSFAPRANAYAAEPIKSLRFVIHDWPAAISKIDEFEHRLQSTRDVVDSVSYFIPKDPVPWLPVATQLAFLMVAVAGWVKSYHGNAYRTIGLLVGSSMLFSVLLVFRSEETIWNIARQSLIPGGFILYWIARENDWMRRVKNRWSVLRAGRGE